MYITDVNCCHMGLRLSSILINSMDQSLTQELVTTNPVKKTPHLTELEGLLPCSQEITTGPSLDAVESSLYPRIIFLEDPF
jgi:hypothetical protein